MLSMSVEVFVEQKGFTENGGVNSSASESAAGSLKGGVYEMSHDGGRFFNGDDDVKDSACCVGFNCSAYVFKKVRQAS